MPLQENESIDIRFECECFFYVFISFLLFLFICIVFLISHIKALNKTVIVKKINNKNKIKPLLKTIFQILFASRVVIQIKMCDIPMFTTVHYISAFCSKN